MSDSFLQLTNNERLFQVIQGLEKQILDKGPDVRKRKEANNSQILTEINSCLKKIKPILSRQPIRIMHHLSCTGGTLFTKCLAAMPNVLMLSEIDPLSPLSNPNQSSFAPTDIASMLKQGDNVEPDSTFINLFLNQIDYLSNEQFYIGRKLILREHSHSLFLVGGTLKPRPNIADMLKDRHLILQAVTVRNPIDSYLSMKKYGWEKHFSPSNFNEYCRRYHLFLDSHNGVKVIKYEDLVDRPSFVLEELCRHFKLDYNENVLEHFGGFIFSGDSGRTTDKIAPRPKRSGLSEEMKTDEAYISLAERLGYPDS